MIVSCTAESCYKQGKQEKMRRRPVQTKGVLQTSETGSSHPDYIKLVKCFKIAAVALIFAGFVFFVSGNKMVAVGVCALVFVMLTLYHVPFGIFVQLVLLSLENAIVLEVEISASMIMGFVVFLSFVLSFRNRKIFVPVTQKYIFALTVWICMSLIWNLGNDKTLAFLRSYLACVVFSFVFLNSIRDRKTFFLVLSGLVLGPMITSSMLMFGKVTYASRSAEEMGKALLHEGASPVALGRSIAFGFLTALGVFIWKKKRLKLLVIPLLILFFLAIATKTQTRMALLTCLTAPVFAMVLCAESKKRMRYFFYALLFAVLGYLSMNFVLKSDLMTEGAKARYEEDDLDRSSSIRFAFWKEGYQAFLKRPLHGCGFVNSPNALDRHEGRSVHNNFVAVVVELGLVGVALFTAIFMTLYWRLKRVSDRRLKLLGMAMLLYPLLTGISSVNYPAKDFWYAVTICMICGLIDVFEQKETAARMQRSAH
jgi:O-antigen ligase